MVAKLCHLLFFPLRSVRRNQENTTKPTFCRTFALRGEKKKTRKSEHFVVFLVYGVEGENKVQCSKSKS
jgi:hypothetical protein